MEIYIIRHTTPDIEKGICYGQSDLNLASSYLEEFKAIREKLALQEDIKVYSSPLKRCALLGKNFNESITFDDRLKELNFGDWELKPWNAIPENEIIPWMNDFVNVKVPHGESYIHLASRVESFFNDLLTLEKYQNVIIVSHAGPIRALLSSLMNIPLKDSFNIKINYGDVFQLTKENGKLKLITEINL